MGDLEKEIHSFSFNLFLVKHIISLNSHKTHSRDRTAQAH